MDQRPPWARVMLVVGLGGIASLLLPSPGFAPAVPGSLVARALVAACVAGLLGMSWSRSLRRWRPLAAAVALAAVLLVALWYSGIAFGALHSSPAAATREATLARVPQPEHYAFDGEIFLRTHYLMKHGVGFYQAFEQSVIADKRHDSAFFTSPFNYREPLVFEAWKLLPGSGGNALFGWFVVWSLATLAAAYLLASSLAEPGVALLAPIALVRFFYFFYWADRTWFTLIEVWAIGLGIAAVAALVRRQRIASLLLLTAAVGARELMVVLVPAWLVGWWLIGDPAERRASWWFPTLALLGPVLVLSAHVLAVPPLSAGGSGVAGWLHGGLDRLAGSVQFGWAATAHGEAILPFAFAVAAIAAAALARPGWRRGALLAATTVPPLFLAAFSGGASWMYWGAIYTPLAASIAPGILGRWFPAASEEDSPPAATS